MDKITIDQTNESEELVKILEEIADFAAKMAYDIAKASIKQTGMTHEATIEAGVRLALLKAYKLSMKEPGKTTE